MNYVRTLFVLGLMTAASAAHAEQLVFEEEFVVEGEVQKPEVTVVITRQDLNKSQVFELKKSFLEKIIRSVERPPFW
jgi:hypothetical protein